MAGVEARLKIPPAMFGRWFRRVYRDLSQFTTSFRTAFGVSV